MEKKTFDIANKSLGNQLSSVSSQLKTAIEEGNFEILPIPYLRLFLRARGPILIAITYRVDDSIIGETALSGQQKIKIK